MEENPYDKFQKAKKAFETQLNTKSDYDSYPSNSRMEKRPFEFFPSKCEIWIDGKMVESKELNTHRNVSHFTVLSQLPLLSIKGKVIEEDAQIKVEVSFTDSMLSNEIVINSIYDEFIVLNDRLSLITVPVMTNIDSMQMITLKTMFGTTRLEKDFKANEPFVCNLNTIKGQLAKVSFIFGNPAKLIEFLPIEDVIDGLTKPNSDFL